MNTDRIGNVIQQVETARDRFECRFTLARLKAIDKELHDALTEQDDEFTTMVVTNADGGLVEFGEGTVRGWDLATRTMVEANEPDGAYQIGLCGKTGTAVVVSDHKTCPPTVREQYPRAVHVTPDEVAILVGGLETVAAVKRLFDKSSVVAVRVTA